MDSIKNSEDIPRRIHQIILWMLDGMISDIALNDDFHEVDARTIASHIVGAVFTTPITIGTVAANLEAKRELAGKLKHTSTDEGTQ